jgi:hypothetical protein
MNLKLSFLNSALVGTINNGVGVKFVDHAENIAANDARIQGTPLLDRSNVTFDNKVEAGSEY